jgi:hypothetical protein
MTGRAEVTGGRVGLASPRTAFVVGVLAAALLASFAPILVLAHQISLSNFGTPFVIELPYVAVGFLVARRQPRNPIGWLLLIVGGAAVLSSDAGYYAWIVYGLGHRALPLGSLAVLLGQTGSVAVTALPLVIVLFPAGRLPAPRWRWAFVSYLGLSVIALAGPLALSVSALVGHRVNAHTLSPGGGSLLVNQPAGTAWLSSAGAPFLGATGLLILAAVAHQIISYRRSAGVRRQQLKSLMAGGAVCVLAVGIFASGTAHAGSSVASEVWSQVPWIAFAALPISIGVAILRYRLYEIDRLVSRTLSYAILTALLVGTFIGLIALTTNALALSGRVGVAASTLAAAALFNPLRVHIQRLVDRRFNRARYDAEATVAAFMTRLRDAVEIDAIRADLLDAVNRAVEPSHASVWIKP